MSDFLSRLKVESEELDVKLEKLTKFNKTKPFYSLSLDAQSDLTEQLYCMSNLSGILRTRIAKAEGYYSGHVYTISGGMDVNCVTPGLPVSNQQ